MKQSNMFDTQDLPLFSGTPQRGQDSTFTPQEAERQLSMADCGICLDTGTVQVDGRHQLCICKTQEEDSNQAPGFGWVVEVKARTRHEHIFKYALLLNDGSPVHGGGHRWHALFIDDAYEPQIFGYAKLYDTEVDSSIYRQYDDVIRQWKHSADNI